MSNIDKQALREAAVAIETVATPQKLLAFRVKVTPQVVLALLDENLQLQREKDAIEAVALALRDDMRQAREQLEAAEKRIAEQREYYEGVIADGSKRIAELEKGHQEAAKQINSWRRLAKQNIAERGKDISELEAARQRIAELEASHSKLRDTIAAIHNTIRMDGGYTPLAAILNAAKRAYEESASTAGIGVKQQEDSVDSDVGSRNQPGMVVAVHIGAGDFVKVKGQVFEVEETDFDDHDVTLWFVGGNALKCAAGCPVEVVSAPVAAGIKVKES
ncbi:ead/Ea22-like family protein [Salmonella enterica subsp. enterica serovar Carrau]|nr:ead/Ea22-like family protein [Salmonella enterica]EDT8878964.1 ead/Ea22-like family protein [Salmonella enterica subsp. enterica]EDX5596814.1 ead/Ea22-like family protein [Salmonella enterica subsp. enterica serovar Saintpaul]EGI6060720.1 ead/Ea22-like family protein [Salmonella enterica subsp. enterica serovar Carrau]EBI9232985.1 Ead protein [Salmonella enterica]